MLLVSKLREYTFKYTVGRDDVLTLLRAVEFEGNRKIHVATTLINYFMALGAHKKLGSFDNIANVILSYATPISPLWFPDGPNHLAYIKDFPDRRARSEEEAARRQHQASITRFTRSTSEAVIAAFKNSDAIAAWPYVTDYAAHDRTAQPLRHKKVLKFSGERNENNLWYNPNIIPNPSAYTGYVNPQPELVEQEFAAWQFTNTGGTVSTELGRIQQRFVNGRAGANNRVTYTVRSRPLGDTSVPVPSFIPETPGTGVASVGQKVIQTWMAGQQRATAMAGSTLYSYQAAAVKELAAAEAIFTAKTTKIVNLSEAILRLPVVIDAIGFDRTTGEWVRRTNATTIATGTAPQPAVPQPARLLPDPAPLQSVPVPEPSQAIPT